MKMKFAGELAHLWNQFSEP